MPYLLQVDFPYPGPWGAAMTAAMTDLAASIATEPGLIWKIWTESPDTGEAGGIYLFEDQNSAQAYLDMHAARLRSFGIAQVNAKIFAVNPGLSLLDRAPI
ncbi:monooxygenase [Bordetella sp. J329]|uniref:monooxygenase n=1 Tax=Kerstersia gyiorum TaxID=206506 RepID=UPI000FDA1055|nr:monooxygenase [Bordetella sp. J329]